MRKVMTPEIRLLPNGDGSYDLVLEYSRWDAELANGFDFRQYWRHPSKSLAHRVKRAAAGVKIRSVKVMLSGVLVATLAFSAFTTALAASDKYTMGYLYTGTDRQQVEYVNQTGDSLDVVSPSYFDIAQDGGLVLNTPSSYFVEQMHQSGRKVVPFLSNHWNRTAGINALKDVETLSTQIAGYVEQYNLDGVNVDIENVTHNQRSQYTQLVRLLREKIPSHKEVSVAVAANPNGWTEGWHGSYDYAALAQYADHLMIMTYDEHYEGGDAGPVAGIDFVEQSIQYALRYTTPDKIVIGVPFYGRVWSLEGTRIQGQGVSIKTIQKILDQCPSTVTYDTASQSVKAEFTIRQGDSFTVGANLSLTPGNYVVWYENHDSYQEKLALIEKYGLKGAGAWALGQEDVTIWDHYEDWVDGEGQDTGSGDNQTPSQPGGFYEVKQGDTLWKIAQEQLGDGNRYREIMELNGMTGTEIFPGDLLRLPGPSGETPSVPETSPSYTEYTVQRGDTLWKIAQAQLGSGSRYREIMELNGLTSEALTPGQVLRIPGSGSGGSSTPSTPAPTYREYTVQRGDSLWKIAQAQLGDGSRYREIMELNGLTSEALTPGQVLRIPGGGSGGSSTPSTPTPTYREYTVQRGDSLWKIAQTQLGSGSRYREIVSLNNLQNETVYPGQVIRLPK